MSGELAITGTLTTNIEQVLLGGDLSKLNPQERLNYYNAVCASLGLNPLTQPFAYIVLNGKLQLYAKKDCTEQLRKIHGVSITKVDPRQIGDLLVVVAEAADREGRTDSSTGAVNTAGLKGENLANAMMKAETKSKRRVTLSLCGLGMLDETEVDTLREQGAASEPRGNQWEAPQGHPAPVAQTTITRDDGVQVQGGVDTTPSAISHEPDIKPRSQRTAQPTTPTSASAPEPTQGQQQTIEGEVVTEPSISPAQSKRFFAIAKSVGLDDNGMKAALASIGLHCHRDSIPRSRYEEAVDAIDPQYRFHQRKG